MVGAMEVLNGGCGLVVILERKTGNKIGKKILAKPSDARPLTQ
jgi:hypothetical protein